MSVASPAPMRIAPPALWRVARAFLHTLHALFGGPEHVAILHTLGAGTHSLISSWMRAGEALMRRIILVEAAAYPKPNTRPLLRVTPKRARKLKIFDAEKPQDWRVSFHFFAPGPRTPQHGTPGARTAARLERLRALGARPGEPLFIFREDRDTGQAPLAKPTHRSRRERRAAERNAPILRQDRFWVHANDLKPPPVYHAAQPLAERYEALLRVFNDPAPYACRLAARLHATPHRLGEVLRASDEAPHRVDRFAVIGRFAAHRWRRRESSA